QDPLRQYARAEPAAELISYLDQNLATDLAASLCGLLANLVGKRMALKTPSFKVLPDFGFAGGVRTCQANYHGVSFITKTFHNPTAPAQYFDGQPVELVFIRRLAPLKLLGMKLPDYN